MGVTSQHKVRFSFGLGNAILNAVCFFALMSARAVADDPNPDGAIPVGTPVVIGDSVYGILRSGGAPCNVRSNDSPTELPGCGVVYALGPSGYRVVHRFADQRPTGNLLASGTSLYGTATDNRDATGQVFRLETDGTAFATFDVNPIRAFGLLKDGTVAIVVHDGSDSNDSIKNQSLVLFARDGTWTARSIVSTKTSLNGPIVEQPDGRLALNASVVGKNGDRCNGITLLDRMGMLGTVDYAKSLPAWVTPNAGGKLGANDRNTVYRVSGTTVIKVGDFPRRLVHFPLSMSQTEQAMGPAAERDDGSFVASVVWFGPGPEKPPCGEVVRVASDGATSTLHAFQATDEPGCYSIISQANAGIVASPGGILYGILPASRSCGSKDTDTTVAAYGKCGALFRIDNSDELSYLRRFGTPNGTSSPPSANTVEVRAMLVGAPLEVEVTITRSPASGAPFIVNPKAIQSQFDATGHGVTVIGTSSRSSPIRSTFTGGNSASVTLHLSTRESLLPDRYRGSIMILPDAISDASGSALNATKSSRLNLDTVVMPEVRAAVPPIVPGTRYLGMPGYGALRDNRGRFVTGRVFRLIAIDQPRSDESWFFHFSAIAGDGYIALRASRDLLGIPMARILDDPLARRVAAQRIGNRWAALPNVSSPSCGQTATQNYVYRMPQNSTGRIVAVFRLDTVATPSLRRTQSDTNFTYVLTQPLAFVVENETQRKDVYDALQGNTRSCYRSIAFFADRSEVDRSLITRILTVHSNWPPAARNAYAKHTIVRGMTREMVVAFLGYPPQFGTIEELNRLDEWDYVEAAPFGSTVYFKKDRVIRYDPPGNLP